MYSENSIRSFNEPVKNVLNHYKCPIRVYKDLWLYVPHTKVPQMCKIYDELILNFVNSIIKKSNIRKDLLTEINNYTGSSMKTVLTVIKMSENREYYKKMRKIKIPSRDRTGNIIIRPLFVMGVYVKLRAHTKKMLYNKGINKEDFMKCLFANPPMGAGWPELLATHACAKMTEFDYW
tara:strand:- start:8613 stop:9146 length:534 start_codon:yes stop_codon:yes gene_type:complete